jgi:hypothetical protein
MPFALAQDHFEAIESFDIRDTDVHGDFEHEDTVSLNTDVNLPTFVLRRGEPQAHMPVSLSLTDLQVLFAD